MTFAELLVFHADLERERQRLYDLSDRAPARMRERLETAAESIVEMQRMLRTDIGQAALDEVLPEPLRRLLGRPSMRSSGSPLNGFALRPSGAALRRLRGGLMTVPLYVPQHRCHEV